MKKGGEHNHLGRIVVITCMVFAVCILQGEYGEPPLTNNHHPQPVMNDRQQPEQFQPPGEPLTTNHNPQPAMPVNEQFRAPQYRKLTPHGTPCSATALARQEGVRRLEGKVVLVTGGTTGSGYWTALAMARMGARVIITSRNISRGAATASSIVAVSSNPLVDAMALELSSFRSVRAFAKSFPNNFLIDVFIHNAAVMAPPYALTEDGFETTLQVNYLSTFLLTHLMLSKLRSDARIIVVASTAHKRVRLVTELTFDVDAETYNRDRFKAYGASKLLEIMFSYELRRRNKNLTVVSLHPGVFESQLSKFQTGHDKKNTNHRPTSHTADEGAGTSVWAAVANNDTFQSSSNYLEDCREAPLHSLVADHAAAFWTETERRLGI